MGYILLAIGLALCGAGVFILIQNRSVEVIDKQKVAPRVASETVREVSDAPLTPKEKGLAFEKFIIDMFDKPYFSIKVWQGDKFHDNKYAEANRHPDLVMSLTAFGKKTPFAVECKWRASLSDGGLNWATEEQIAIYNQFAKDEDLSVFVAIGVGGTPDAPASLYIVPLTKLRYPFAKEEYLEKFKCEYVGRKFFYNRKNKALRLEIPQKNSPEA